MDVHSVEVGEVLLVVRFVCRLPKGKSARCVSFTGADGPSGSKWTRRPRLLPHLASRALAKSGDLLEMVCL